MAHRRINVLFLMIQMAMGGTERLIYNLVKNLDRSVFSPSIGWFAQERPLPEFEALGVPLHYIPKNERADWPAMRQIAKIVHDEEIDVVNAHHFMSFVYAYYGARVAGHAALIYTEHSENDVLSADGKWKWIGAWLLRSCQTVGISSQVASTLASHFSLPPQRVHAIENGVDASLFAADPARGAEIRREFGFGAQDIVIGHVGTFRNNKNHMFLLRAFRELSRRRSCVKLVFVGQGFASDPENSELEMSRYIDANGLAGVVRLAGYRPDVHDVVQMFDISCLVSYKEGLPLSLIEAMAAGLPVIGTDIPSIRSVIEPEINGLLVMPDDDAALANAMERLCADEALRDRMGAASRRIASERYSLQRCIRQTADLFRAAAAQVSAPGLESC